MEAGGGVVSVPAKAAASPQFVSKLYNMVDDPGTNDIVLWSRSGDSFIVKNPVMFSRALLPRYFRHCNFDSFTRQLNYYGFRKVSTDCLEYANERFLRDQTHLLNSIKRRSSSQAHGRPYPPLAPTEERHKGENQVLTGEFFWSKVANQLSSFGRQIHDIKKRVLKLEMHLGSDMESQGFAAAVVHQQNGSNRQMKRRLLNQDRESSGRKYSITSPGGQIAKCQPLINVAEKAEPRQILGMNLCPLYSGSSSNRISAVISSEVLPNTVALTEIQSSSGPAHADARTTIFPQASTIAPDYNATQGLTLEKNTELCEELFRGAENIDSGCEDTNPGFVDASAPASDEPFEDSDDFLHEVDELQGGDVSPWEQFLSYFFLAEDTDRINTVNLGDGTSNDLLKE